MFFRTVGCLCAIERVGTFQQLDEKRVEKGKNARVDPTKAPCHPVNFRQDQVFRNIYVPDGLKKKKRNQNRTKTQKAELLCRTLSILEGVLAGSHAKRQE